MIAAALALGTGLLCLIGRLARLGFLADLLSKPVLIGYMCGIAVLMIVSQLSKVTGISVHGETVLGELASVAQQLRSDQRAHHGPQRHGHRACWRGVTDTFLSCPAR